MHIQALGSDGSDYYIDDVTVTLAFNGSLPANAGGDTTILQGQTVCIGNSIGGLQCTWYANDTLMAGETSPCMLVNPQQTTEYVVRQAVCGTISWDTVVVTVLPTGIANLNSRTEVAIYPNPTRSAFEIILPQDFAHWQGTITDTRGAVVAILPKAESGKQAVKLQAVPGLYFVRLRNEKTGVLITKKLSIQP